MSVVEYKRMNREVNKYLIRWYKELHPCVDCGEKDPDILTFDHINGKNFSISKLGSNCISAREKLLEEIKLCVIRCFNCHIKRTRVQERLNYPLSPPVVVPSHRDCGHRWGKCKFPTSPSVKEVWNKSKSERWVKKGDKKAYL